MSATIPLVGIDRASVLLERHFGYPRFRAGQARAIEAVLAGRDAVVLMPTGGGKSLCYQIPSQLLPGTTLVVSPLISLMKDQVDGLARRGIAATFVNSTLSGADIKERLERVGTGQVKLLYVAPERFQSPSFRERLKGIQVSLLAVDEAHCISTWGHDFRPSYLRLGHVRDGLGCPAIALTATATPAVRSDIARQLRMREPVVIAKGFDRPNLRWHVLAAHSDGEKDKLLRRLLQPYRNRFRAPASGMNAATLRPAPRGLSSNSNPDSNSEGVAIVYASTRRAVDSIADLLIKTGIAAAGYHAGVPGAERKRLQEAFMQESVRVVVATNAFGMGIDKPNVRLVVHYQAPASLEDYYQEAGRAGRDGSPADCVLLFAYRDRFTHEFLIERSIPERLAVERVYALLIANADAEGFAELQGEAKLEGEAVAGGEDRLETVLRVLENAGVVRGIFAPGLRPWIRLVARPARIRRELPEGTPDRGLLRALWGACGPDELYRGREFAMGWLERIAPGADDVARLLDRLQAGGFLEWRPPTPRKVPELLLRVPPGELPVDWAALDRRRSVELDKLRAMQAYAYQRRCRRSFVLRYFGDLDGRPECAGCDRCEPRNARIVPGWPAPRRHSRTR